MKLHNFEITNANNDMLATISGEETIYIRINNIDIMLKQNDVGISIDTFPFFIVDEPLILYKLGTKILMKKNN